MKTHKIFGPPGTGKTSRMLTYLDQVLSEGNPPERIAFLTFTVQAREVAVKRVREQFGFKKEQMPYFKTLHSVAFHQQGMRRDSVLQDKHLRALSKFLGMEFTLDRSDLDGLSLNAVQGGTPGDKLLTLDHLRRHRLVSLEEALTRSSHDIDLYTARYFTAGYQKWKAMNFIFDYTDLLERVWEPVPVDYVFVDEAQDLSRLQWRVLDTFARDAWLAYVAGDDDQAIFEWAGADPSVFLDRPADTFEVLGQSYRVPRRVHDVAVKFTEMISRRQPKEWNARDVEGTVEYLPTLEGWVPRDDGRTMVLYRNHSIARGVERHLRELGFAYSRLDRGRAAGLQHAQAIVLWEKLRRGHALTPDEWTVVDEARDTSTGGVDPTRPWYEALDRMTDDDSTYLRRVIARSGAKGLTEKPHIELSTIHAAKGDEAEHVVVMTDMSKRSFDGLYEEPDAEARVMYVATTRAKETLTVVGVHHPLFNGHSYV
jgi:DNA helicase-2/ATP-dependent DNA helicase PcrA